MGTTITSARWPPGEIVVMRGEHLRRTKAFAWSGNLFVLPAHRNVSSRMILGGFAT